MITFNVFKIERYEGFLKRWCGLMPVKGCPFYGITVNFPIQFQAEFWSDMQLNLLVEFIFQQTCSVPTCQKCYWTKDFALGIDHQVSGSVSYAWHDHESCRSKHIHHVVFHSILPRKINNGILLQKLFWPTMRKKKYCSDQEKMRHHITGGWIVSFIFWERIQDTNKSFWN